MTVVLDTHVFLEWLGGDVSLSDDHERMINRVRRREPLVISDITMWEVATLFELGRITIDIQLREWLEAASAPPLVRRIGISPQVAAEVAALPSTFHRDPADRIIVASARVLGATLLTRDERIIRSALVETA